MPDVRTLLDTATARAPHPDPVAAVHARIDRRAARQRTAVVTGAALTALTIVAGGAVASRLGAPARDPLATPSPSPSLARGAIDQRIDAVVLLAAEHPEVFLDGISYTFVGDVHTIHLTYASDADREYWDRRVDIAAGGVRWTAKTCPDTYAHYEGVRQEVLRFAWPSGAKRRLPTRIDGDQCAIEVTLDRNPVPEEDLAAARDRWGRDVLVRNG